MSNRILKTFSLIFLLLILILALGPFLIPVPSLENLKPVEALADPDSQFLKLQELNIHLKSSGTGDTLILLLHGFGSSVYSWREVMEPLAEYGQVVAYDRPGFGLTERPVRWEGPNPYSTRSQVSIILDLVDYYQGKKVVLVGNSAGGRLAVLTALENPGIVSGMILVSAAVYTGGSTPAFIRPILNTPQMDHLGPLISRRIRGWGLDFARSAWADPNMITAEIWAGYQKPLQAENWDRGLWEYTQASESIPVEPDLRELTIPTLVITGAEDQIVPAADSIRLASELPAADLVVIPACGHVPQEECPQDFLAAVNRFLARLEE